MKNHGFRILLVFLAALTIPLALGAQTGELKGIVFQSNWGPVFLGWWEDGYWGVIYESDDQTGIIIADWNDGRLDGRWYQFTPDFESTSQGGVMMNFHDDSSGFDGSWTAADGSWGGEWNGTFERDFDEDDAAYFTNMVDALKSLSES